MNAVVIDLARHPEVQWAVVFNGQLLPGRFATEAEGTHHLAELVRYEDGKRANRKLLEEANAA